MNLNSIPRAFFTLLHQAAIDVGFEDWPQLLSFQAGIARIKDLFRQGYFDYTSEIDDWLLFRDMLEREYVEPKHSYKVAGNDDTLCGRCIQYETRQDPHGQIDLRCRLGHSQAPVELQSH